MYCTLQSPPKVPRPRPLDKNPSSRVTCPLRHPSNCTRRTTQTCQQVPASPAPDGGRVQIRSRNSILPPSAARLPGLPNQSWLAVLACSVQRVPTTTLLSRSDINHNSPLSTNMQGKSLHHSTPFLSPGQVSGGALLSVSWNQHAGLRKSKC